VLFGCYFCCSVVICVVRLLFVFFGCYLCCLVVICVVRLLFVLFGCYLCCSMYCLCVNVYCHRMTTQLQLINISYIPVHAYQVKRSFVVFVHPPKVLSTEQSFEF
jgi:hypothetical protein